ncbi:GNAT family N-acetyltransferase [Aliamphritea hakodatensis]|uniref:GNAT family N-acetyltransferase n=1 Tax=Aliamphritea hakodatensis TaxID=2895352 RepID=UPI0022FD510F|nr:GNAT family N-acetyltransferase [Aliamphritea hakodatensis]
MTTFSFHNSIADIGEETWDALVHRPDCGLDYPFIRYGFLHALESSGSVSIKTGWQPFHLVINDPEPVGVMPLYVKQHSYGEYVFDWAWADAYQRYGLEYYPKLLNAIPFTPSTGPRLCLSADLSPPQQAELHQAAAQALTQVCRQHKLSGWHSLFLDTDSLPLLRGDGVKRRLGSQYHWFNQGYHDFDDFLSTFSSRKRKNVRKERQKINQQAISHRFLNGQQITDAELDRFYDFYQITYLKRGRSGYLNRDFFRLLCESIPENLLFCIASKDDQDVAAALYLQDSATLYGRYWGSLEAFDSLHFETCYYQGIDYCIANGLKRFDPGAQGEHKIQRGFKPIETWSVHWLAEAGFDQAISQFLAEEETMMREHMAALEAQLPFKADNPDGRDAD